MAELRNDAIQVKESLIAHIRKHIEIDASRVTIGGVIVEKGGLQVHIMNIHLPEKMLINFKNTGNAFLDDIFGITVTLYAISELVKTWNNPYSEA